MSRRGRGGGLANVEERVDQLNKVVSLFVDKVEADFDLELAFAPSSITYMDVFLTEAQRGGRDLAPSLYLGIGGYVGETLIRAYGGRWQEGEENLVVELDGQGHTRQLPIFEWVKDAHADPHEDNLCDRLRGVLGDELLSDKQ